MILPHRRYRPDCAHCACAYAAGYHAAAVEAAKRERLIRSMGIEGADRILALAEMGNPPRVRR